MKNEINETAVTPAPCDAAKPERMRKVSLINRHQLRRYVLEYAAANRSHRFTRVGEEFLTRAEAHLRGFIRNEITILPSNGKTIL